MQGFKNIWGQCQMPLGGGGDHFWGVSTSIPPEGLHKVTAISKLKMHLFIAHGFLSLDIGNENHIGVPVINLCHNKKQYNLLF